MSERPRGWDLAREWMIIIGAFAFITIAILSVVMLRRMDARRRQRDDLVAPVIDEAGRVFYFKDREERNCFAIARVHTSKGWMYLMTWVPCLSHLPVATPQIKETSI